VVPLATVLSLFVVQLIHILLDILLFDDHFSLFDFMLNFTEFFSLGTLLVNEIRKTSTLGRNFFMPFPVIDLPLINLDLFLLKFN